MTSQGSTYARFRRALGTRNPTIVTAAAAEVGRLSLGDALAVTLVFLDSEPERFERALVRWHGRYCLEVQPAADEAQLVLAALRGLAGPARPAAAHALLELMQHRGMVDAAQRLADLLR